MCPVQVFRTYGELRDTLPSSLLVHENGAFLSQFQFIQVFRRCLGGLGKDAGAYSSHSFRIVAATEVTRWGLSSERVKRIGHWESD